MEKSPHGRDQLFSDTGVLILLALARLAVHMLTNHQYGFHRDELATLDDARTLAWGYVAYPPLTPFIARIGLILFGPSMVGIRFFTALAQSIAMVLAGLIARELGGSRRAQIVVAIATGIGTISVIMGALFQYISFDYLWWVLIAYLVIRLLNSDDPRWWLPIGAVIGLGMMTKYTMIFYAAGIAAGALLTGTRRHLRSPWLWAGVALSLLIVLPNLIWQAQHDFISLEFLSSIHQRDVEIGRTQGYLVEQLFVSASPVTIPLWLAGLYFYLFSREGSRYRMLSWMYLVPFALFLIAQGRSYYLAPAYPMLIAGGVVLSERWPDGLSSWWARLVKAVAWTSLAVGAAVSAALMLPIAPVNSPLWEITSEVHDNFAEEIGWPELAETMADIYADLPPAERSRTAILAGNYGEAGAINLYGPAYGLPDAISGINSYWLRGYGDPPQTLIVLGYTEQDAERYFRECELAGHVTNRFGVDNEETLYHPDIFICREPRQPWPDLWDDLQRFG